MRLLLLRDHGYVSVPLPITVRNAVPADLIGILEVQAESGRSTSTRFTEDITAAIDDENSILVVAESGGRVVGWAKTQFFPEPAGPAPAGHYLMGVTVAPVHRRQGVASALLSARMRWIQQRESVVFYFTNAQNHASIALHRRAGFLECGRGPLFRGVPFEAGEGILFSATLS